MFSFPVLVFQNKQKTRQKKQECRNKTFHRGRKISPKKTHEKTNKQKKTKKNKGNKQNEKRRIIIMRRRRRSRRRRRRIKQEKRANVLR